MRRLIAANKRLARLLLLGALLGGLLGYGGPAQETFPGRNGRIAYSVGPIFPQEPPAPSQVFTINPDGSGRRQLTHVAADQTAGSPAWSPDGSRIAYVSNVRGDLELWVMAADGSGQRRLTNLREPEQAFFGTYSPNGRRVAVYAELGPIPDALTSGIYTMDAGGGPLVPVFTPEGPDVILFDWGPAG